MKNIALNSIKTLGTIVKIIILSRFYNILKSKHQQKKGCVILGNGPSLTKSLNHYENKFESYDLICVNNFAISEFYTKIKPNYYIVAAPILYQDEQT